MSYKQDIFIRNVLTLIKGTTLAHLFTILTIPFLQKYFYSPEEFGIAQLYFEFTFLIASVASLKIETGIVLEKDDKIATSLFYLCLKLVALVTLFATPVGIYYIYYHGNQAYPTLIYAIIPVGIIIQGILPVYLAWFNRMANYKSINHQKISQTLATSGLQLGYFFTPFKNVGLILGRLSGILISLLYIRKLKPDRSVCSNLTEKALIERNKDFILYTCPAVFVGNLINFLALFLMIHYFGEEFGGKIGVSKMYIGTGLAVLSTAFSQVYYKEIAGIENKQELRRFYTYWLKRLIVIAGLVIGLTYSLPDKYIENLLGQKWTGLIPVLKIMTAWMAVMFISSSLSYIYIKVRKQKIMFLMDVLHLILLVLSIYIPQKVGMGAYLTLICMGSGQILYYIFAIILAFKFINQYETQS